MLARVYLIYQSFALVALSKETEKGKTEKENSLYHMFIVHVFDSLHFTTGCHLFRSKGGKAAYIVTCFVLFLFFFSEASP